MNSGNRCQAASAPVIAAASAVFMWRASEGGDAFAGFCFGPDVVVAVEGLSWVDIAVFFDGTVAQAPSSGTSTKITSVFFMLVHTPFVIVSKFRNYFAQIADADVLDLLRLR